MFDIGFGELVLCVVVALVVFGPDKLPKLIRDIGNVRRRVSQVVSQAKTSLEKEISAMDDPSKPRDS